jgi:hypothetical protein
VRFVRVSAREFFVRFVRFSAREFFVRFVRFVVKSSGGLCAADLATALSLPPTVAES